MSHRRSLGRGSAGGDAVGREVDGRPGGSGPRDSAGTAEQQEVLSPNRRCRGVLLCRGGGTTMGILFYRGPRGSSSSGAAGLLLCRDGGATTTSPSTTTRARGWRVERGVSDGYLGFAAGSVEGNRERRSSARPAHGMKNIKKPGTATIPGQPDGPKALRAC
jgi:hypothetical protein